MQALDIYEGSLCPGCQRPVDVCAADSSPLVIESHFCSFERAKAIQQRMDEEDHKNDKPTYGARLWSDGLMYWPRPASANELAPTALNP